MTTAVRATATRAVPAISPRKTAIAAGILYLITHVTSVGAVILYAPMLSNVNYIAGSGPDTRVLVGAFLEVILTFAIVGTAVALYPVLTLRRGYSPTGSRFIPPANAGSPRRHCPRH
jgi:hypothetical protein